MVCKQELQASAAGSQSLLAGSSAQQGPMQPADALRRGWHEPGGSSFMQARSCTASERAVETAPRQ